MRTRLLPLLITLGLALILVACGPDEPTLIAGDAPADTSAYADDAGAVADDSSPIEVGPTTTAPWEVTLEENPLLGLLDEDERSVMIGSANFLLIGDGDQPVGSGSEDFPQFITKIDAWYGVNSYITFTISTSNVELIDGKIGRTQCGNNWAGFSQTGSNTFQRTPNQLPEVRGTELAWSLAGCGEYLPVEFDSLFANEVEIAVSESGFVVSQLDMSQVPAKFKKLEPETPRVSQTTSPPESTTTTAAPTE